jgi:hypothetical protein
VNCKFCDTRIKKGNTYCGNACQVAYQNEEKLRRWMFDGWNPTNYEVPAPIRKFLLEAAEYKCTMDGCGWAGVNPISGKTTLQIDHIDGNASNNLFGNLRVICPNCHSLTPTYGGLNRGKGRATRYAKMPS